MKNLVLALSAAVLFSGTALADQVVVHKDVNFSDINFSSKDSIVQLHARLAAAADEVCADSKAATGAPYFDDCRQKAMKQAIADVSEKLSKRLAAAQ